MKKKPKKISNFVTKHQTGLTITLALFTAISLLIKLNTKTIITYSRHDTNAILYLVVSLAIYFYYKKYLYINAPRKPFKILSAIFTFLLIFGYSFDVVDSAYLVYGNAGFVAISIIKVIGLYPLIYTTMNVVYNWFVSYKPSKTKKGKMQKLFDEHPFLFTIVLLLICYLPYIIAYYPAIMGYDPANQIKEVMGIHTRYMDSVVLLDPNVTITNFNPVIHTLLLGNCFKLGVTIGNVNLGLFLYSIIQITCMLLTLGYSICFLKKEGVPNKILYFIIGIYIFVPIFPFYALSTNKDTFFTLAIMLYIIKLYELLKCKTSTKDLLIFIAISIFLFLSRNNGIYTILLSLPFFLLLKDKRKIVGIALISILISYIGYSKVLLPHFKITPTSIRETLSIPFQQTAALINRDEDVIEEKDKEIISKILDYDAMKNKYDPELADPVKNTFNRFYEDKDLEAYFKVWAKYLVKRPLIYVDATINNMYGYFYPDTSKWYLYTGYNTKLKEAGYDYHFNKLSWLRNTLEGYGSAFQYLPVLGLFVNIGFNVWIYLYLLTVLIVNKNKKMILILTPALSLILVCIASPANTYFRYAMPYIMTLPIVLALINENKNLLKN